MMKRYIVLIVTIGILLIPGAILSAQPDDTSILNSVEFLTHRMAPMEMVLHFNRAVPAGDIDIRQISYPDRFVISVSNCGMGESVRGGVLYQDILSDGRDGVIRIETFYDITHDKISFIAVPLDGLEVMVFEPEPGVVIATYSGVRFENSLVKNLIDAEIRTGDPVAVDGTGFEDYLKLDQAKLFLSTDAENIIRNYFSWDDEVEDNSEPVADSEDDEDTISVELDEGGLNPETGSYKIQVGDELALGVAGEPEMGVSVRVRPDGYVSFPIIGDVRVAGKTTDEVRADMKEMLQPYYSYEIIIDVLILEFIPQKVYLLGKVFNAGSQLYVPGMTILDTLSNFDQRESDLSGVKLIRGEDVYPVDLIALFDGDTSLNYDLEPGDYIVIRALIAPKANVLGKVRIPGDYTFEEGERLFDLIGYANGFDERCDIKRILVMRLGENGLLQYHICNLLAYREEAAIDQNIFIKNGDIIIVPEVGRPNWDNFFRALGTINSLSYWTRAN